MYPLVQKALFQCDPEWSHDFTLNYLKRSQHNLLKLTYQQTVEDHPVKCLGLTFKNPLGLAAGLDKNGECIDAFSAMGFGFIEVGTVTPLAQPGNEKPRMFRLPDAKAIINRMGFNNKGVDYLVEQVKQSQYDGVLGINIGKNKQTEEKNALDDYLICLKKVYAYADYVTVNISSPNTPGLRSLQYGEALDHLLLGLKNEQQQLSQFHGKYVPLVVKIAPDLTDEEVQGIAASLVKTGIDGVIATNTTLDRSVVEGLRYAKEAGGLSGEVLTDKSLHITKKLAQYLDGAMPIIGVGGIHSSATANERLSAGASLVQIYSSFIYQGPPLIKQIVKGLV
ncbi:quinone-dependent dihydroorotate dehydrogenase [Aliiglaciecola sp. 2_MG-2023]|uniref:quinone-dependent dihydroorotate dehydrogenase n=1 Tax=unclassified Aliiglaciecola TaxID=2593648 RepID=UPI0026E1831F|nr:MULTISPECIES: quinone-dependent dihydroorotate dehydrogenase [unclassified Aliiglaciecola]MDO6710522.1 quinone-dependent dihydroorotate dehydrogenase [Aliiglaciecola sp. 2_MG-2023]MDO6751613.1 quinone-dependent dihydroorotate dehydrogenase [Aliiglaciecola sp. 1_MG-2023]